MQASKNWSIEARALKIKYTPFTHNFWVLVNPNNSIIDQIHGLAVDPNTGVIKAIGNSNHLLQVIQDATIIWSLQSGQATMTCVADQESVVKNRWQRAVNSIPAINALRLPYPNLWQHSYRKNSNTVFNTIGQIMGFPSPAQLLPTRAPGINLVISKAIINHYIYNPLSLQQKP